MTLTLF
jgi:hypothetical protein